MKKSIIVLMIILSLPGICLSQKKVGTKGGQFLLMPSSIRSIGMGQVGAALVDEYSFNYNPGSLGLYYLEDQISITPWTGKDDIGYGINFEQPSLITPLLLHQFQNGSRIGLSFAFSYTEFNSDTTYETDYSQQPTGRMFYWTDKLYSTGVGIGFDGPVQISIGGSYKYFTEKTDNIKGTGNGFDIGTVFRIPMGHKIKLFNSEKYKTILLPSFGFAYNNLGSSLEFNNNEYDVFWTRRLGLAITLGLEQKGHFHSWRFISIIPAFEIEKTEQIKEINKYGAEFGLFECFYFRLGKIDQNENTAISTWGFTINSGGFFKTIMAMNNSQSNKILNFFANRLTFQYSEAHYDHDSWNNNDPFRGFSIRYKLSRIN